jgi:Transcriptional regulator
VNIDQLEYLVEASKTGSISKAAQNLHVSQSTISKSIQKLEHDTGIKMFTRSKTGVVPTAIGKQLIHKASEIHRRLQEFDQMIKEHNGIGNKVIKISSVDVISGILSRALEDLMQQYPHTQIDYTVKVSGDILEAFKRNSLDLAFTVVNSELKKQKDLVFKEILDVRQCALVNKNSHLADKPYLTPEDIIGQRIIMHNGNSAYFESITSLGYSMTTNNIEAIRSVVERSSAISFLSELTINNYSLLHSGNIVAKPLIVNGNEMTMKIAWVKLKTTVLSKSCKELLQRLKQLTPHDHTEAAALR